MRLTLSLDGETQDANFQSIDEAKPSSQAPGGVEMNFRDTWKFNVAAYRLDRQDDSSLRPEGARAPPRGRRTRKKLEPPQAGQWNGQMQIRCLFDQLIFNTDRTRQNVLIDAGWSSGMIDHTRAFRWDRDFVDANNLGRCERIYEIYRNRIATEGESGVPYDYSRG